MAFHIFFEGWINWVAFKETMGIDGCQCKKHYSVLSVVYWLKSRKDILYYILVSVRHKSLMLVCVLYSSKKTPSNKHVT